MDHPSSQVPRFPVAVVYLARKAEGIAVQEAFARSYADHPPGIRHDFVVLFKGYDGNSDLAEARAVFAPFPHASIELPDTGFDLGSFFAAAERLPHEYICCLNTYSRILANDWLNKLYAHAAISDVGIVGATASYEGLCDTIKFVQKGIWLGQQLMPNEALPALRQMRQQLHRYFAYHMGSPAAFLKNVNGVSPANGKHQPGPSVTEKPNTVLRPDSLLEQRLRILEPAFNKWWAAALQDRQGSIYELSQFPAFPNPHIRTNAFLIERRRFLALKHRTFVGKMDACRFESGADNLTRQILAEGLKARIVGRNGVGYDVADWPSSNTFRLGSQDNLLVADNQTSLFETFNGESRTMFALMSWGKNNIVLPRDFPELGVQFQADRNAMQSSQHQVTPSYSTARSRSPNPESTNVTSDIGDSFSTESIEGGECVLQPQPMNTALVTPVQELLNRSLDFCGECLNRQDYTAAWQALCRALRLAPDSTEVLSHRGHLALFLKDIQTAERDFAKALRVDPRFSAAWSGMARYYSLKREPAQAAAAADHALSIDPANEEAAQVKAEVSRSPVIPPLPASPAQAPEASNVGLGNAERDALRKTIYGPFSTEVARDTLQFESRLPLVTDREGARIIHPPEHLFPPYLFRPLNVRIDPTLARSPRLNILLPSTSAAHNSGGPNTAYLLAAELARAGVPLRIVAVNMPSDRDSSAIRAHIARISGVSRQVIASIQLVDGNDRGTAVALGENDVFLATAWWTAQMIKYLLPRFRNARFIYLIQDYEPNLHPISTNSILALETYDLNCFPVVNSRLLFDHFVTDRVGRFADPDFARESCWFEPAVDRGLYHAAEAGLSPTGKHRLLFYARPDAPRNLLELGVAALMRLLEEGVLKPEQWDFYATVIGVGGSCRPVRLSNDGKATLVPLPLLELSTWAAEMRRADVLLSLIWSPHTSYPVLEGAACGVTVVTNSCGVKTADRLREISTNIIGGTPTIEGIADALTTAAGRSANWAERVAGTQMGLPTTWRQSFAPVLPRLLGFLKDAGISALPGLRDVA